MEYTIQKTVSGDFDEVVETTINTLKDDGFGVLCDIDVQATLKEKLGEEFRQYRILGACNPALAQQGLNEEIELGALLPCNVIVYETDGGEVVASAVEPHQLLKVADNEALDSIATEVHNRFERILASIAEEFDSPTDA